MAPKTKKSLEPLDYIEPLNINGMNGRMLRFPATKPSRRSHEILLIYGHHSSLERWFGLVEVLAGYGTVTMPDLPGFGGMDSFYTIGRKPTIDNLADYLAAFIKLRYKRKHLTIVGMSIGFVIATRMLQRYPELTKKVDLLVSLVGFAHKDDFSFGKLRYWTYRVCPLFFELPPMARFFRGVALNPFILRTFYGKTHNAKRKMADLTPEQVVKMLDVEVGLWRDNEVRTYMFTTNQIMRLNNCHKRVDLPVWHVAVKDDHFFDNNLVEQHMRVIFSDFIKMTINMTKHAPTTIAEAKDAAPFLPARLRRELTRIADKK